MSKHPTPGDQRRRDRTHRRPGIEPLEGRQLLDAALMSGDPIALRTRRDHVLVSAQGIAPVTAVPGLPTVDAAFTILEAKGNGDGRIQDGERIALQTRRGMTLNSFDSRGQVYPIGFTDYTNDGSDQLFTIRKAVPGGDPEIRSGDPVLIVTRHGYFWNSWDSRGDVQAIPVANTTTGESDEIFTVDRLDPSALAPSSSESPFVPGQPVSLAPVNLPSFYLRHRAFELHADPAEDADLYRNDATFVPRPGLGDPSLVSFESVNFPGRFLRHRNLELFLDENDGSDLFRRDATFRVGTALGGGGVTLESLNLPGWFVRHRDFRLRIEPYDGMEAFRRDATFQALPGLTTPPPPPPPPPPIESPPPAVTAPPVAPQPVGPSPVVYDAPQAPPEATPRSLPLADVPAVPYYSPYERPTIAVSLRYRFASHGLPTIRRRNPATRKVQETPTYAQVTIYQKVGDSLILVVPTQRYAKGYNVEVPEGYGATYVVKGRYRDPSGRRYESSDEVTVQRTFGHAGLLFR